MSDSQLTTLLRPLIKPAHLLKLTASADAQHASTENKFGGLPYAEKDDNWPVCSGCGNNLLFVAQLKHPAEKTLHTFFYCFECFPWGMGDEEKGQWLVRSYQNPDMANYVAISSSTNDSDYPIPPCNCEEQTINILPALETLDNLLPEAVALCGEDDTYEIYDAAVEACGCLVDYATFMGGYPKWIQSESVKTCPQCEKEMEFFAQIDSEDEADLMWGDCGAVYLFRCPDHKNEFGFELQCY